jgi:hypothetical protein
MWLQPHNLGSRRRAPASMDLVQRPTGTRKFPVVADPGRHGSPARSDQIKVCRLSPVISKQEPPRLTSGGNGKPFWWGMPGQGGRARRSRQRTGDAWSAGLRRRCDPHPAAHQLNGSLRLETCEPAAPFLRDLGAYSEAINIRSAAWSISSSSPEFSAMRSALDRDRSPFRPVDEISAYPRPA